MFFCFFLFFFPISLALPMSPAGLCFKIQLGRGVRGCGLGPEDPGGAFPTLIILGFCNFVIQGFAGAEFPQKLPAHQKHFSQTRFQPYFDTLSPPLNIRSCAAPKSWPCFCSKYLLSLRSPPPPAYSGTPQPFPAPSAAQAQTAEGSPPPQPPRSHWDLGVAHQRFPQGTDGVSDFAKLGI